MTIRIAYALVAMLFATSALAQTALPFGAPYNVEAMAAQERLAQQQPSDNTNDSPRGAPYHVEQTTDPTLVPLRDYLSSRIDQLRSEIFDRIDQSEKQAQKIIDERDHQYAERFSTQNQALTAAFLAQKDAVANALASNDKRLDSLNEFRGQLSDQATTFLTKEGAEGRFRALEDKIEIQRQGAEKNSARIAVIETGGSTQAQQAEKDVSVLASRVTEMESRGVGLNQAWLLITSGMGLIVGAFVVWNVVKRRTAPIT